MLLLLNAYPRARASDAPESWELKGNDDEAALVLAYWWFAW